MTVTTGTDRRWQMKMPTTARHSQVVTSRGTENSLYESVICHKTVQTSSSHRCGDVVRWQNHRCGTWNASKRIGRYFAGKPRAKCWFRSQQSVELEAYSDADLGGDKATRRSVSAGVIIRGGHCFSWYGPRNSKWCRCRPPVKTASEGLGIQSVAKDLGTSCRLNLHSDASATMCLVNRGGLGKAKARQHAESVDTGGIPVRPVRHEEGWLQREPSRLDDETVAATED